MINCFISYLTNKLVEMSFIIFNIGKHLTHKHMKSKLLFTAVAVCLSYASFSQTKGTNAISFGASTSTMKTSNDQNALNNKNTSFFLGYSHFINDNSKLGLDLSFGKSKSESQSVQHSSSKNYGVGVNYQRYYPIVKKLYAYAGGRASADFGKGKGYNYYQNYESEQQSYTAAEYGGVTWFLSKRFAFETTLLSASAGYLKYEEFGSGAVQNATMKQTSFDLSTTGFINDLGFKIYILF